MGLLEGGSRSRLSVAMVVSALALMFVVAAPPTTGVTGTAAASPPSGGTQLWASLYNGPGNSMDAPAGVAVAGNGKTVIVTGRSDGTATGADYATVAYNPANGHQRWVARYNGPGNSDDIAWGLAVSADGKTVYVTGTSRGPNSVNYATVAYDVGSGRQLWVARDDGQPGGSMTSVTVSPDGTKVFVTGTVPSATYSDFGTVAYNATNGNEIWFARYDGPLDQDEVAFKIGVSPNGNRVYVTGSSRGSGTSDDYATVAYNAATGTQLWVARYNGPGNSDDIPTDLGVSPDGTKIFVTGQSPGATTGVDYATVAYNAITGTQLWVGRYNGPANLFDGARSVGVSPDGTQVFVTGISEDVPVASKDSDATVAYNTATGAQQWVARYSGPLGIAVSVSLAVSPDGTSVFITGFSSSGPPTSDDYATVAYTTTNGTQQWVAIRKSAGDDTADSIATSPDSKKVFVTGCVRINLPCPTFPGPGPSEDYGTIAYDARP